MNYHRHKFNAVKIQYDGFKFPSKKEGKYYLDLKLRVKSGEVVGFFRQTALHFPGNIKYVMDFFVFHSDGTCEAIEVKGYETKEWKIKQKLIKQHYPWLKLRVIK